MNRKNPDEKEILLAILEQLKEVNEQLTNIHGRI